MLEGVVASLVEAIDASQNFFAAGYNLESNDGSGGKSSSSDDDDKEDARLFLLVSSIGLILQRDAFTLSLPPTT